MSVFAYLLYGRPGNIQHVRHIAYVHRTYPSILKRWEIYPKMNNTLNGVCGGALGIQRKEMSLNKDT